MPSPRDTAALKKQLDAYAGAVKTGDAGAATKFIADNADFRANRAILRGRAKVSSAAAKNVLRASGEIVGIKWLSASLALVDGHYEVGTGKGWFTEIWSKQGSAFVIRSSRTRQGSAAACFEALSSKPVQVVGDIGDAAHTKVEAELRVRFKAFRTAFNNGDKEAMLKLFTKNADAIVAFSFLKGRAQILAGKQAIGDKGDRMMNKASNPAKGAAIAGGEPKVIQVLSATVAMVDGTAEIGGIPKAHEFSPTEMKGVYTDIWVKSGANWAMEGTRPWF